MTSTTSRTFHLFSKLPAEIRLAIFEQFIEQKQTRFVDVAWHQETRDFRSCQRVPPILHVNRESRAVGLKTYQLAFASSPEFARVYFSFKQHGDVLFLDWSSLGTAPGRIARKICDEDLVKVRSLMVREDHLLLHSNWNMRELLRFTGLECISVLCDQENPESGRCWGEDEMQEYSEQIEGEGDEKWPELVCLRDSQDDLDGVCSRHWWFGGWNDRASTTQKEPWASALSSCLQMTAQQDETDVWLDMLFQQRVFASGV